jgi:hypothetical protein
LAVCLILFSITLLFCLYYFVSVFYYYFASYFILKIGCNLCLEYPFAANASARSYIHFLTFIFLHSFSYIFLY